MRTLLALLLTVTISGCGADSTRPASGAPGNTSEQSTLNVGETIDFWMYTHCGVESTRINGQVWNAGEPLRPCD